MNVPADIRVPRLVIRWLIHFHAENNSHPLSHRAASARRAKWHGA
jgi:hypothetical protein